MNKRVIRTAATVLAVIVASTVFVTAEGKADGKASSKSLPEGFSATGLPIVTTPVTLSIAQAILPDTPSDPNKLALVQDWTRKTNVKIEWVAIPMTEFNTKVNLMFASGSIPDVFLSGVGRPRAYEFGSQGMLAPLQELVEKYSPNVQEIWKEVPGSKEASIAPDGKIYGLVRIHPFGFADVPQFLYINKQWLDSLGLAIPKTTEDFYAVLKAFKTRDPNGNGKADEIPFGYRSQAKGAINSDHVLLGSFGPPGDTGVSYLYLDGNKPRYYPAEESFKKYITYLHRLYSEGLTDPEAYVMDGSQMNAKGQKKPPVYGAFSSWFANNVVGLESHKDYIAIPPLKGPDGFQFAYYTPSGNASSGDVIHISGKTKYPEVAMRMIDYFFDPLFNMQMTYGPVGTHLEKVSDTQYRVVDTPAGKTENQWKAEASFGGQNVHAFSHKLTLLGTEYHQLRQKDKKEKYDPYLPKAHSFPLLFLNKERQEIIDAKYADINNYVQRVWATWVMNGGVEKEWDAHIATLKKMGLDEILSIYEKAYAEMKSRK